MQSLYQKYIILDAKTRVEKKGRYFVLKIDTTDACERSAVKAALMAYSKARGDDDLADEIERIIETI